MKLHMASNFSLPAEAVTETFAILGIRGSGKTNTGVVITEELLAAKQQVVVIDPVDVWWGLRSSKDGKQPVFGLPVIGGDHADLPLDGSAGSVLADFVTDSRSSVILALRNLSMNDQRRFAGDFAKRLYERKGQQRSPLMLMVDEADEFVPQRLPHGHEAMFGAFDRLVRRGRSSGIGVTLISQRAQVINKDVLSQMGTLICMRVLHKLDRKAVEAWIEAHDTEDRQAEFMASLASLGKGDAWIWSPSWLGVFERIHIRARETFDSSTTPKAGDKTAPPQGLAPVDLEQLRILMAATIERQQADDPKLLRARIAQLERDLKVKYRPGPEVDPAAIERAVAKARRETQAEAAQAISTARSTMERATGLLRKAVDTLLSGLPASDKLEAVPDTPLPGFVRASVGVPDFVGDKRAVTMSDAPNGLTGPEQRILDAIAWMESIGIDAPEQTAVAFLAGYTVGGGAFNNPRGALRTKGLVLYTGDCIALTDRGREVANFPAEVLDTAELQRRVLERLPGPERRILEVIIARYPKSLSNEECALAAGYTPGGGAFNNPRGRLRTLGLIEYPQSGYMKARELLFLDGQR